MVYFKIVSIWASSCSTTFYRPTADVVNDSVGLPVVCKQEKSVSVQLNGGTLRGRPFWSTWIALPPTFCCVVAPDVFRSWWGSSLDFKISDGSGIASKVLQSRTETCFLAHKYAYLRAAPLARADSAPSVFFPIRASSCSWCVICWTKGTRRFGSATGRWRAATSARAWAWRDTPRAKELRFLRRCSRAFSWTELRRSRTWWAVWDYPVGLDHPSSFLSIWSVYLLFLLSVNILANHTANQPWRKSNRKQIVLKYCNISYKCGKREMTGQ